MHRRGPSWRLFVLVLGLGLGGSLPPAAQALPGEVLLQRKVSATAGGLAAVLPDSAMLARSIAGLGDLDGDGIEDVALGAPNVELLGSGSGTVHVLLLAADGTVRAEQTIGEGLGGFLAPLDPQDQFGSALACLGDLDGDGVNDLAVGARGDDDGDTGPPSLLSNGAVYVLFLEPDGSVRAWQKISALEGGFGGAITAHDEFGAALAAPGDLDGDGNPELVVGAPLAGGKVFVLFLNADGSVRTSQQISAGVGGFGGAVEFSDLFGWSLAAIGDLDGDGRSELGVGAIEDDDGGIGTGTVWVLFLAADGSVTAQQAISPTAGGFTGTVEASDHFGSALAGIGDVDCDGVCDLAAGASGDDDGAAGAGAVWVLFLDPSGSVRGQRKISALEGRFAGPLDAADQFGLGLGVVGDLEADGEPELAVGAPLDDDGGTNRGAAWILSLRAGGGAAVAHRNAGSNPDSYRATPPVLGGSIVATVDLAGTTGHASALVFGFDSPFQFTLGGGQVLLCLDLRGSGELFSLFVASQTGTAPVATIVIPVPLDAAFCGLDVFSQALHFGGVLPFALSNAQDLAFGFWSAQPVSRISIRGSDR